MNGSDIIRKLQVGPFVRSFFNQPRGTNETLTKKEIFRLVNHTNPIIFEIGCADGADTEGLLKEFPDENLKLFCFEPDPRNLTAFKSRIDDPRAVLMAKAVGDKDGRVIFHQTSTIYSSSLKRPNFRAMNTVWPTIKLRKDLLVDSIRLDTFMSQKHLELVDFVWVDVQGAEDLVLKGAKKSLEGKIRYFYTEYHNDIYYQGGPRLEDIIKYLGPNWEVVHDFRTDILFRNKHFPM